MRIWPIEGADARYTADVFGARRRRSVRHADAVQTVDCGIGLQHDGRLVSVQRPGGWRLGRRDGAVSPRTDNRYLGD